MTVAIRIEKLGKRYRIGELAEQHDTLGAAVGALLKSPISNYRRLRSMSKFSAAGEEQNVVWALRDVSFDVATGTATGIIGQNGAGKSTLLKILSRITPPSTGRVVLNGRVASLLEVGTGFHPEQTGRENIYLNGAILGMKAAEIERRFDEIVAFSGVEKFIDTPVKFYSSGMRVRLAFSVAAHLEPEILLIDEVLAVGDSAFQKKCLGKMQSVAGEGRTVLFVSHDMPSIARLCPRAVLLSQGRVFKDGPSSEVVAAYLAEASRTGATRTWDVEDDGADDLDLSLREVGLIDADGKAAPVVSVEQDLWLRIGYRVNRPNTPLRCAAKFYTQGACAFVSVEPNELEREQVGDYFSVLHIPANLLSEGDYTVGVSLFSSRGRKIHYALEEDAIVFQVYDPVTGRSARGDYTEPFAGVMRPLLEWNTQRSDGV